MTLHIWSRLHCRWEVWRGTLAAWKALPHAVVTGCAITVGAVVLHHFAAPRIAPEPISAPAVPAWVYTAGLPTAAHSAPLTAPSYPMAVPFTDFPGAYAPPVYRCKKRHKCKKSVSVSFGAAPWWLLVGLFGVVMLCAPKRVRTVGCE